MQEESRDILIEMRSDVKHVRETMELMRASDTKQWEKLDTHNAKIEGHEKTIGFLVWGFRLLVGGIVTGSLGWAAFHK